MSNLSLVGCSEHEFLTGERQNCAIIHYLATFPDPLGVPEKPIADAIFLLKILYTKTTVGLFFATVPSTFPNPALQDPSYSIISTFRKFPTFLKKPK